MSFTGTVGSVLDAGATEDADAIVNEAFQGMINYIYTMYDYLVSFFTQSTVIVAVVVLAVVASIGGFVYRKMKAKAMGGK